MSVFFQIPEKKANMDKGRFCYESFNQNRNPTGSNCFKKRRKGKGRNLTINLRNDGTFTSTWILWPSPIEIPVKTMAVSFAGVSAVFNEYLAGIANVRSGWTWYFLYRSQDKGTKAAVKVREACKLPRVKRNGHQFVDR